MDWREAISFALSQAPGKRVGRFPTLTNREASGLILFARQVTEYAVGKGHPVSFDWYAFALTALGWRKSGDVFDMSTKQQISAFPASTELWGALEQLASRLDEAKVPFELVRDPTGTESTYKRLAEDAWTFMQRESPLDAAASQVTAQQRKASATASKPRAIPASSSAQREQARGGGTDNGKSGAGWGAVILIALVAYAATRD